MLERGKPIVMAMGKGVRDSSTTRYSTVQSRLKRMLNENGGTKGLIYPSH
jgi:hypothetical protein